MAKNRQSEAAPRNSIKTGPVSNAILSQENRGIIMMQSGLPDPSTVDIAKEIKKLSVLLADLDSPQVNQSIKAAVEEAKKPQPQKDAVGGYLQAALEASTQMSTFAKIADQIRPHVVQAAGWLGANWHSLVKLVGHAL